MENGKWKMEIFQNFPFFIINFPLFVIPYKLKYGTLFAGKI